MRPFTYERANDPAAAARAAAERPQARFIAGGTNLLDLMKLQIERPAHLIDVSRLPLGRIEEAGGGLRIGATVRNSVLAADERVRRRYPVLSQAPATCCNAPVATTSTIPTCPATNARRAPAAAPWAA
jgi:xanthine dehydrogenase YagS FAD-binding subunit